jgi:choline dehydrogenase
MSHDPQLYGDGPVEVGWQGWVPSTNAAYMKALSRVGINPVKDLNSGVVEGVAQGFMPVRQNWTRVTAYEAYVKPIRNKRPNLTVLDRSYVERILFDPKTEGTDELKAIGFTWYSAHSAIYHNTSCKLDVISSLGSIATPQLLMVSGIGPQDNLASVGVRTLIDMPELASDVADHDSLSVVYKLKDEFGPGGSSQDLFHTKSIQSEQDLYFWSDKPYLSKMTATSGCTNGFGTYSNTTLRDIGAEEIHDIYSSGPAHVEHLYESQAYPGACSGYFTAEPNKSYISLTISNLVPTSKGTIRLGSNQMQASPIIDPHVSPDEILLPLSLTDGTRS